MAAPERSEAIQILDEGCAQIERLMAGVPAEDALRPRTIGGGEWSAKDLLGHIAFWEELASEALESRRLGVAPHVEAVFGAGAAGVDAANEENFRRTSAQSMDEVLARKSAAHAAVVAAISEMSDQEWRAKASYPGSAAARRPSCSARSSAPPSGPSATPSRTCPT